MASRTDTMLFASDIESTNQVGIIDVSPETLIGSASIDIKADPIYPTNMASPAIITSPAVLASSTVITSPVQLTSPTVINTIAPVGQFVQPIPPSNFVQPIPTQAPGQFVQPIPPSNFVQPIPTQATGLMPPQAPGQFVQPIPPSNFVPPIATTLVLAPDALNVITPSSVASEKIIKIINVPYVPKISGIQPTAEEMTLAPPIITAANISNVSLPNIPGKLTGAKSVRRNKSIVGVQNVTPAKPVAGVQTATTSIDVDREKLENSRGRASKNNTNLYSGEELKDIIKMINKQYGQKIKTTLKKSDKIDAIFNFLNQRG